MSRQRLTATEARRRILDAAERQLAESGVEGVRIQEIAGELGVVPATILHHFGSRDRLLDELMLHGAGKLDARLDELIAAAEPDLERVAMELFELYESRGYASLFMALSSARKRSGRRRPAFRSLLDAILAERTLRGRKHRERAAEALLALNLVAFADALVGRQMRQAVGLPDDEGSRARFRSFVGRLVDEAVGGQ